MADIKLQALLTAKDEASGKIKGFENSLGKLSAAVGIGTLAAAGFQKAVSFVTDTVRDSIAAAVDAEKSQAKVDAILKTLTGDYNKNAEAVNKASDAALKLGFDDEDAAESMAKLLQVTGDTTSAQQAQSAAMDLARMKGIDLQTATQAMTLAWGGNTKILKQLGVEIPDNASKMEVLGMIQEKVKGQAEAFGNTAAGAQEKFKNSMENLQESIGGLVLPIITTFFNRVSNFVSSDKFQVWIKAIGDFFSNVIGPIIRDTVVPAWDAMKKAIEPHVPLLTQIIKIVGGVAGTALVGAFQVAVFAVKTLAQAFGIVLEAVERVIDAIKSVIDWIGNAVGKFNDFKSKVSGGVTGAAGNVGNFFSGLFGRAHGGLIAGGRPELVGENGPEVFLPSSGGRVVPNDELGGSVTVNFNNPVVRSDQDLRDLANIVKRSLSQDSHLLGIGAL